MSAHIHRDQEAVQVYLNLILHISLGKDKVDEQQACLNINAKFKLWDQEAILVSYLIICCIYFHSYCG